MKNRLSNSGFSTVAVLVVIAVIGVISAIGYYVWDSSQTDTPQQVTTPTKSLTSDNNTTSEDSTTRKGVFKGIGTKTGSGSVSVIEKSDGTFVVQLEEDFMVQKGPALYVAFGNGQTYAKGTAFTPLKSFTGKQEYQVPSSIEVEKFDSIMIWCEEFSTAFSAAPF